MSLQIQIIYRQTNFTWKVPLRQCEYQGRNSSKNKRGEVKHVCDAHFLFKPP